MPRQHDAPVSDAGKCLIEDAGRCAASLFNLFHGSDADPRDKMAALEVVRGFLNLGSPVASQPVDLILWVPIENVKPNDYNPNAVAPVEMKLLYTSILHDGYTQPIVTVEDDENPGTYVIVDGFHRYFTAKNHPDILERNLGRLPIVVIQKDINDRMASTVRHNRARGKHSVGGMSSMVFSMLDNGWADEEICNELGMEAEELVKLKHLTGFSKLFADADYKKAWRTTRMIRERAQAASNAAPPPTVESVGPDEQGAA